MINPFKNKKGLGRGLSSLIGDSDIKTSNNNISVSSIIPNKNQPRKLFEKEALEELTNSIKERGIVQPLIVRKSVDQNDKYELIAGERRWHAAQSAGLHEVPAVIIEADNLKSLEFAIIENVQRKDLNPIEEAESYKNLIENFNYDNDKVLIGLENALLLAEKIVKKKLSVRQTENLVRLLKNGSGKTRKIKDANTISTEKDLSEKIGMRVSLNNKKDNSGSLIFEYKGFDQLDRLIKIIKENY
jgi:ParB family chromosome partitioning protein